MRGTSESLLSKPFTLASDLGLFYSHCYGERLELVQISVIIPTYNRAGYLAEAIESVLAQTYPVFETIVVDDGSLDNTREVCACYPQVHYVYQKNQGVSAARNTGIRYSKGDYLIFLDSDDRLLPHAVEVGVNCMQAHPEAGFVFGHPRDIDSNGELVDQSPVQLVEVASYATILSGEHIIAPAGRLVRRSAIEATGEFLTGFGHGEDTEYWLRLAQKFPIYYHQQLVFEYRYHNENASNNTAKMLLGLMQVLQLQRPYIKASGNRSYKSAYRQGKRFWLQLYGPGLFHQVVRHIKEKKLSAALWVFTVMLVYYPQGILTIFDYLKPFKQRLTDMAEMRLSPVKGSR